MLGSTLNSFDRHLQKILNSPFGVQLAVLTFFIFFITGFYPAYFTGDSYDFKDPFFYHQERIFSISEPGFIDNFAGVENAGMEEVLIQDEEGNLIRKIEPRTLKNAIEYTVKTGDTLLSISHKFGLNVSTLLWGNNLTAKEVIRPGQKLKIPPADGVYYIVELGDTLGEIAQWHEVPLAEIYKYNDLDEKGTIHRGKQIFLPGARKMYIEHTPVQETTTSSGIASSAPSRTLSSIGFRLRRPAVGTLTQGVRPGHTALDIANAMNTGIYAAHDGVVIESRDGWNYGYGKYIIIDHGNNIQTLYAHLNTRNVQVGQTVKKGEFIGGMGNSGNVIGPTGIHLHFEVRINGRKVNPNNYF